MADPFDTVRNATHLFIQSLVLLTLVALIIAIWVTMNPNMAKSAWYGPDTLRSKSVAEECLPDPKVTIMACGVKQVCLVHR